MMPAGRYYVGDLCYVMTDEEWDEVCGLLFEGRSDHGCNEGEFTLKDGRRFVTYNTKYGDGRYESNMWTDHSVDSGGIGCIRLEDIRRGDTFDDIKTFGAVMNFAVDFATGKEDGVIQFDRVMIDTN
jgi:hypothetical protein